LKHIRKFYLRASGVDEVPRGEGTLDRGLGVRKDGILKLAVSSFRLDSAP
jgi:hypothetical protein